MNVMALFIIDKAWKQPRCPSVGVWINKRDQIANICWIIKKAREFQKNIYFCFIDYAKDFVWITINRGQF